MFVDIVLEPEQFIDIAPVVSDTRASVMPENITVLLCRVLWSVILYILPTLAEESHLEEMALKV